MESHITLWMSSPHLLLRCSPWASVSRLAYGSIQKPSKQKSHTESVHVKSINQRENKNKMSCCGRLSEGVGVWYGYNLGEKKIPQKEFYGKLWELTLVPRFALYWQHAPIAKFLGVAKRQLTALEAECCGIAVRVKRSQGFRRSNSCKLNVLPGGRSPWATHILPS